jgi:three-Cys-motif partner protein
MSPKQLPTIWRAEPHTIAKIEILTTYLVTWFQILGRSRRNEPILYVDGFAGPGEYTNYPNGSPVAALLAAQQALSLTGSNWIAGDIHCAFIETQPDRFRNLNRKIATVQTTSAIHVRTYANTFPDGIDLLQKELPGPFISQNPLFVFIDPFGATGVPFATVAELLSSPTSEVLINLDADGIARIFRAGNSAGSEKNLNEIFAGDEWRPVFRLNDAFEVLCRKILQLYKQKLLALNRVKYVFPFEMRTSSRILNYYLVFASQHPLGLERMKEAMRKIDQSGSYRFSDASVGQSSLFRFDKPEDYSLGLYERFRGRMVTYAQVAHFALNETPFTNPKQMLRDLECTRGLIDEVTSTDPKRRKGTFNEEKISFIKFI